MNKVYTNKLRKAVCTKICIEKQSTSYITNEYGINLKTVEKWVTRFNKDNTCFDKPDNFYKCQRDHQKHRYDDLNKADLIIELQKRDRIIEQQVAIINERKLLE